MVPDSLSRRTLLGGVGAAVGASLLGAGLFAPTWLPDPVTDELVRFAPEPPDHLWRPTVTDAHADSAVSLLERTVEEAEALRERIDTDSLSRDERFRLRGDPSGGHLQSARDASNPHDRLFSATYGMQFAGETVGYAKVHLDEVDAEDIVERGAELRTGADDVLESVADCRVSDPATDLARLYAVERELAFARLDSHRDGVFTGGVASADEYDAHDVATTMGAHLQATQRLRNARFYRDRYRERLGENARPYAARLEEAAATLTDAVDEYPRRHELQERLREDDVDQSTPYGAARWELHTLGYDDDFRFGFDADGYRPGHLVQRVVETARALLGRRAHEFALEELDVSPSDADYDSGRTLREKRRAMERFRSVRGEYDSPFAGVLAEEAAARIRAGDIGLGSRWDHDDGRPAWQDRVESATYFLIANGQLQELGAVFETVVGDGN